MIKLPFEKTIKKIILRDCIPTSVVYSKKEKKLDKLFRAIKLFWIPVNILLILSIVALLSSLKY